MSFLLAIVAYVRDKTIPFKWPLSGGSHRGLQFELYNKEFKVHFLLKLNRIESTLKLEHKLDNSIGPRGMTESCIIRRLPKESQ